MLALRSDLRIELCDQAIPLRNGLDEIAPESLVAPALEILERDFLLFHPGEIAEIEDPLAIEMSELEHVIICNALHVTAEDLAGIDLVEAIAVAARQKLLPLAGVKQSAVGGLWYEVIVRG